MFLYSIHVCFCILMLSSISWFCFFKDFQFFFVTIEPKQCFVSIFNASMSCMLFYVAYRTCTRNCSIVVFHNYCHLISVYSFFFMYLVDVQIFKIQLWLLVSKYCLRCKTLYLLSLYLTLFVFFLFFITKEGSPKLPTLYNCK